MKYNEENEKMFSQYKISIQKNILSKLKQAYVNDPQMLARIKETSKDFLGREINADSSPIKTITIVPEGSSLSEAYQYETTRICHELGLHSLINPPSQHPSLYDDKTFVIFQKYDFDNAQEYDFSRIKSGVINIENKSDKLEINILDSLPNHLVSNLTISKNQEINFNTDNYQTVELKRSFKLRDIRPPKPRGIYTDNETIQDLNNYETEINYHGKIVALKENPERSNKMIRYIIENNDIVEKVFDEKMVKESWYENFELKMKKAKVNYAKINFITPTRDDLKDKIESLLNNGTQVIYMNFNIPFTKENAEGIKESINIAKQLDARVVVSIKNPKRNGFTLATEIEECLNKEELLDELDSSINDSLLFNIKHNVVNAIKKMKSNPAIEGNSNKRKM